MLMIIFQHQSTIVEALATPDNADFMTIFYYHVDHVHLQGIFLEARYRCIRITCNQSDQNLFLYVQHSCNLKFKCCKASTLTSHCIIKSHRILYSLFSISHSSAHTYQNLIMLTLLLLCRTNSYIILCGAVVQWLSLLHNLIQQSLNSGFAHIVLEICDGEDL